MKNSLTIANVRGIEIRLHVSWLLVLAILTYALATGFFPMRYEFDTVTNWALGAASALLLFISVFLHELAHSVIAQKKGLPVRSITLFFFGGLANIESDPEKPMVEFKISIGGPLASLGLGVLFYLLYIADFGVYLTPLFDYLSKINFMLAIFNMIPAFPLDGGRVFRSIIWAYTDNLKKATRIASNSGKIFGALLIALGIVALPAGLWFIFLGIFLMFLAESGYKQVLMRFALEQVDIKELVAQRPLINPDWSIEDFFNYCRKENVLAGIAKKDGKYYKIDLNDLPSIKKSSIEMPAVSSLMTKVKPVKPEEHDTFKLFKDMQTGNENVLPVIENDNYIGVITSEAFYRFIKIISVQDVVSKAFGKKVSDETDDN